MNIVGRLQAKGTCQPHASWAGRPWVTTCRAAIDKAQQADNLQDKYAEAKTLYTEKDYMAQHQAQVRSEWASNVRRVTGKRDHRIWEPELSPPALLSDVVVVLLSPRRPVSVGTVARACSCFEVENIRIVQPRCEHITRHSKSASKGSQYLLYRARVADSIQEATHDCDLRVAFTRWTQGLGMPFYDLPSFTQHPYVQSLVTAAAPDTAGPEQPPESTAPPAGPNSTQSHQRRRIALVFGREELGLSDDEVKACDCVCSIPIGRLQESLSLSHAVSLALSTLFQARMMHLAAAATSYVPTSCDDLAAGYDSSEGQER